MIGIQSFCLMACVVSLLSMMIRAVTPSRMQKQVDMVVNLFLLLCLLTPLSKISLPAPIPHESALAQTRGIETDALLKREIEHRIEEAVVEKLEKNGIFPEEVRIDITVADNGVEINSASVSLRTQDEQARARALAGELLQCEVHVSALREGTS